MIHSYYDKDRITLWKLLIAYKDLVDISSTPTLIHHHVLVMPQHHVVIVVVVEHGDGGEADRDAAGLRRAMRVEGVHKCLQDGMVGTIEALAEREGALAMTVVCHVALWGNDPVLPAHVLEVDVEAAGLTDVAGGHRDVHGTPSLPGATLLGIEGHSHQRGLGQQQTRGWQSIPRLERKKLRWILNAQRQQLQNQAKVATWSTPTLGQHAEVHGDAGWVGLQPERLGQQELAANAGIGPLQCGTDHFVHRDAEGRGPPQQLCRPKRLPVECDLQLGQGQHLHRQQGGHVEEELLLQAKLTTAAPAREQPTCTYNSRIK